MYDVVFIYEKTENIIPWKVNQHLRIIYPSFHSQMNS